MADQPAVTEIEKMPTSGAGNVNAPTSGTYGEDAALQRLKSELPPMAGQAPEAGGQPIIPEAYTGASAPPPGLPPSLFAPTQNPDVPVQTPLATPAPPPPEPKAQRILALQRFAEEAPSQKSREWAQLWLNRLIREARA